MNTQPEALRLADAIEKAVRPEASLPLGDWARAAAELRRLHAQRDALLESLVSFAKSDYIKHQHPRRYAAAIAAIKAVEGEKT